MSMTPEQQRQKSIAEDNALRHQRYAQADGSFKDGHSEPMNSPAIHAAVARVNAATAKEEADMGIPDRSPNASIRF